jgi:hypothetical protein
MGLLRSPEPFIFDSYKHVVPPGPRHFTFSLDCGLSRFVGELFAANSPLTPVFLPDPVDIHGTYIALVAL